MAFFRDPGEMFLGCLGTVEQRYLVNLIKNAAKNGYTRFVEPCAGTFAMSNLAIQNGYKPEQIETSDVSMMSSVMGYAITGKSLDELEIHAQGFSDEELLDPAIALYAQMYLRTSKTAGNEYFFNLLKDLRDRREEHIEHIRQSLENIKKEMHGMSYRPLDMWDHLDEVLDDPHTLVIANPPTYFSGYEKFYDTQGKMTWKEPEYKLFDPETGHVELFDRCMNANALVVCYQEKRTGEAVGEPIFARAGTLPRTEEKRRRHWQKEERLSDLPRASWHRLPVVCCRGIMRLPRKARCRLSPLRQQRHSITDSYGRTILLVHRPRSIELF